MFLWFIGTATVAVLFVFRDDRFDFRVLALGAVVPDLVDVWSGGAWVFHSVLGSVAVLAVVMATARRGSLARRRWLALPIGMFFHLVFDGVTALSHENRALEFAHDLAILVFADGAHRDEPGCGA